MAFTFTDENGAKNINSVCQKFAAYCNPRKNVIYERYVFWQSNQQEGETIDQYITSLKQKVKSCEYDPACLDEMVRDKLVFGVKDLAVKERLLREENVTLQKAVNFAHATEVSKKQIKEMSQNQKETPAGSIHAVQESKKRKYDGMQKQMTCNYCGKSHPPKKCPAYGKTCKACSKVGHFESVCRSKPRINKTNKVDMVEKEAPTSDTENNSSENELELLTYSLQRKNGEQWCINLTK